MRHKVKAKVRVEKRGLFGKKYVYETRTIWVDDRTYRELKRKRRHRPLTLDEMILIDILDENDL